MFEKTWQNKLWQILWLFVLWIFKMLMPLILDKVMALLTTTKPLHFKLSVSEVKNDSVNVKNNVSAYEMIEDKQKQNWKMGPNATNLVSVSMLIKI